MIDCSRLKNCEREQMEHTLLFPILIQRNVVLSENLVSTVDL